MELRPFQRRFLARALSDRVDTSVLSLPRGNGKSTLAAYILERCLTPGDRLFEAGRGVPSRGGVARTGTGTPTGRSGRRFEESSDYRIT